MFNRGTITLGLSAQLGDFPISESRLLLAGYAAFLVSVSLLYAVLFLMCCQSNSRLSGR